MFYKDIDTFYKSQFNVLFTSLFL